MDLLDQLDDRRHDTMAVLDLANEFDNLTDAESAEHEGGVRTYSGLDDAQHPFTTLLKESHNQTCVVRDLDGSLQLMWTESSMSNRWARTPLHRENLIGDRDFEDRVEADPDWLPETGLALPTVDVLRVLSTLPHGEGAGLSL